MQCWLCPGMFPNKKELRLHLAAAPHFRLKVVCPWCAEGERASNRIGDLKRHVVAKHPGAELALSADFFSEAVGFYLALHPNDYARVTTPAPSSGPSATAAIHLVKLWLEGVPNPSRTLQEWQAGWNLGDATPLREEPMQYLPTAPPAASPVPPYSPTRPDMFTEGMTINMVKVAEDRVEVDVMKDKSYFVVTINSSVKRDRTVQFIKQLMNHKQARPHGRSMEVKGTAFEDLSAKISARLQISETFIDHIKILKPEAGRLPVPFPTCSSKPAVTKVTPATPRDQPLQHARQLLGWGIMPLIPPSRRNWDTDEAVTLCGRTNSIKWPPRGWRTFTAERRLQVFEFAAGLLDADMSGFPVTPKSDILDKYNFLGLPGSLASSPSAKSAMRYANYNQLRAIALGEEKDLRMLRMFGNASHDRDQELDHLIKIVDDAGIKLRLER